MLQPRFPVRPAQDLTIQKIGEETLVYHEERHLAFCLDRVASAVWARCDGEHSVREISEALSIEFGTAVPEDAVLFALAQLEQEGLLQPQPEFSPSSVPPESLSAISRRLMLARMGAGAVMMLPVVAVIVAPRAAQAYNGCVDCLDVPQQHETFGSPPQPPEGTSAPAPKQSTPGSFPELFKD